MNIAEMFIRRPVMTTLLSLAIVFFGIMAYRLLPVSDLPNVDFPTIVVSASLPGASPDTMASSIATPLEKQFSTIAGLDSMTSTSILGGTNITLQFTLCAQYRCGRAGRAVGDRCDAGAASARDAESAVLSKRSILPTRRSCISALSSTTLPISAGRRVRRDLSWRAHLDGVAESRRCRCTARRSTRCGSRWIRKKLASRGIGIDEVAQAIQTPTSIFRPARSTERIRLSPSIASGQLMNAAAYRPLVVAYTQRCARAPRGYRHACSTACRTTRPPSWSNGEPRRGAGDPAPARHQHRRGRR